VRSKGTGEGEGCEKGAVPYHSLMVREAVSTFGRMLWRGSCLSGGEKGEEGIPYPGLASYYRFCGSCSFLVLS
jgi:hypothetical protein